MKRLLIVVFFLIAFGSLLSAQGNAVVTSGRDGFVLYRCEAATNDAAVTLSAYLADASGGSLLTGIQTVSLEAVGLGTPTVRSTTAIQRQPVRIVLILDTTSTMPLSSVINSISTQLFPQLEFNDQVALITFTQNIAPITPFFTDKNRLVNEYMFTLQTTGGTNRMFDAVRDAISALSRNASQRNLVLFVTDSNRRDVPQTSISDLISSANAAKIQIYPLAILTDDRPDESELRTLAERTNGFSWYYSGSTENTALKENLDRIMNQFIANLNQEVAFSVDVSTLDLSSTEEFTIKATITATDGTVLSDTVDCPAPQVEVVATQPAVTVNTIAFADTIIPPVALQPVEIQVEVATTLPASEQLIVFLQNGEIVQSSPSPVYTLRVPTLPPGTYSISAQLRNLDNTVFATTDTSVTVNTQQVMALNLLTGSLDDLDSPVRIAAQTNSTLALPDVRFTISHSPDHTTRFPLGAGSVAVQNGSAILALNSLRSEITRLFPNTADGETFLINAQIPSAQPDHPLLAEAEPLTVTYRVLPPPPVNTELLAIVALCVALLLLNVIAFFRVKRARVRRMISRPDGYDLPNRLMAVTVYRDALKHTVTLTRKTMTVGRGATNDINIGDDNKVSRQHGAIMWRRDNWYYTNRKGDVSVKISGRRVRGFKLVQLESVTEIEMGDARVFFHSNSQQDISELTRTNL